MSMEVTEFWGKEGDLSQRISGKLGVFETGTYPDSVNKLLMVLFIAGALFGMMALMPEGQNRNPHTLKYDDSVEREPGSHLPHDELRVTRPASGEPSDDGLTQNLHREFRDTLGRDPLSAIERARELIYTKELDPKFRLDILRELKVLQFSQPGVSELASEILENPPESVLFEEALTIKYASLSDEEFLVLVSEMSDKIDSPEHLAILSHYDVRKLN